MAPDRASEIKARILAALEKDSLPLYKVAELAEVSVATASKFVHILEAERKVRIERFGDMKLVRRVGR